MILTEYTQNIQGQLKDNVLKGVLILGPDSKNSRRYTSTAMKKAVPLYEGAEVYVDHGERPRKVEDRFGAIRNPYFCTEGKRSLIRGDLEFLDSHTVSARLKEDVEKGRGYYGLSHCAEGNVKSRVDGLTCHEITKIIGVDLVTSPATTMNLFEETNNTVTEEVKMNDNDAFLVILEDKDMSNDEKLAKFSDLLGIEKVTEEVEATDVAEDKVDLTEEVNQLKEKLNEIQSNIYLKPRSQPVDVVAPKEKSIKEIGSYIRGE